MSQSFSLESILYYAKVRLFRRSLAIPHFSVLNINDIDPIRLKNLGFSGIIFDKDNTLTAPYVNQIFPAVSETFLQFKSIFGNRIAILSNSAGTKDDRNYEAAERMEQELGIKVLRHKRKKPYGIEAVEEYFECPSFELVSIGDRIFTDVVFGNRYGMLTFHTQVLTEEGDNRIAIKLRRYESKLVEKWRNLGIEAPPQKLLAA